MSETYRNSCGPISLGTHWLIDLLDCRRITADPDALQATMLAAAKAIGATIVCSSFHRFEPQGLSGVVIIGESHLAVHTWPEHRAVCVDLFTCSPKMNADPGIELLKNAFDPESMVTKKIDRGRMDGHV